MRGGGDVVAKVVNGEVVRHLAFRFFVTVYVTFSDRTRMCGRYLHRRRERLFPSQHSFSAFFPRDVSFVDPDTVFVVLLFLPLFPCFLY